MNSKALLTRLERIEVAAFGIDREGRGEQWIERERRLLRLYFAMGLTGSGIVGAIGLLVLLAVAAGPGYEAWFGTARKEARAQTAWDEPASRVRPPDAGPSAKEIAAGRPDAAVEFAAGTAEPPLRPPFVRVISVVPVAQKAAPPPPAKTVARPINKSPRETASGKPAPAPEASAAVEAAVAVAPLLEPEAQTVALLPPPAVERPDGIVNLGGPGRPAAAEAPATWWRKLWWGTGGFAASQK